MSKVSGKHHLCVIDLNHDNAHEIVSDLRFLLGVNLSPPQKCEACGGLLPEIGFNYDGKEYRFTCHEIRDKKDKVIVQTDYKQLGKWCEYQQRKKDKE